MRTSHRLAILAAAVLPALLQAQTQAQTTTTTTTSTSTATPSPLKPATAPTITPEQRAALEEIHKLSVMTVKFAGDTHQIIIKLEPEKAPGTVANFIQNVDKGTYKGLAFHRTIADYLVQTGDPASRSNDNRDSWGLSEEYTIPGEFKIPHTTGSVAMARRSDKVNPDRKSNGTQFYFAVGDMSSLNGQYSVFGDVVVGLDVLKKISRSIRDSNDAPIERIEIVDIKVVDHKGPVVKLTNTGDGPKRRGTSKPDALKGPFEKFLDRVW
ncbi:peptidylprolyl isomerase [Phragmitibacter flavus]|nr:peptidylprolyl isomerase [Phragmitibacter flavus]